MLESRSSQLLPISISKDSAASSAAEQQQKRVLEKVWVSVEKAMTEMRNVLNAQLQDASRSLEEREKTLEWVKFVFMLPDRSEWCQLVSRILLELQGTDEPLWTYFDSQHKYIMAQMNKTSQNAKAIVRGEITFSHNFIFTNICDSSVGQNSNWIFWFDDISGDTTANSHLWTREEGTRNKSRYIIIIILVSSYRSDEKPGKSENEPVWEAVFSLVKSVSEVLLSSLPDFWKISKNFMDGKYKKVCMACFEISPVHHCHYG